MSNARDTQFAESAKAVCRMIESKTVGMSLEDWTPTYSETVKRRIIAQYAHDLVRHTIEHIDHINLDRLSSGEHVTRIPDMATWPEEQNG